MPDAGAATVPVRSAGLASLAPGHVATLVGELLEIARAKKLLREVAFCAVGEVVRAAPAELLRAHVLPGYLEFHRDLLFHQTDAGLFNSFFVGRMCEATLRQGPPWDEPERIVPGALARRAWGWRLPGFQSRSSRPVSLMNTSSRLEARCT